MSCRFCMEKLENMVDPRKLPCGHVFCLDCLKGDFANNDSHRCITCRETYVINNFEELPRPVTTAISQQKYLLRLHATQCDRCETMELAVNYCIDCEVKICSLHKKHHIGFFGDTHQTVDIANYTLNPAAYKKRKMCHKHRKQAITMVCKACFQFNCEECHKQNGKCEKGAVGSIYSMQPMTSGKDHAYESLDDVHQQVKSKFEAIRTSVSSKLNVISKGVKDAYKGMDDVPERFEEMKQEIKRKANEQIELIKNQSKGLIEQVDGYQEEKLSMLVEYIERNNQTKTGLEEVMKQSHQFCQKEQTLMIREHEAVLNKLNKWNGAYRAAGCDTTIKRQLRIGLKRKMEMDFESSNVGSSTIHYCGESFYPNYRLGNSYNGTEPWNKT